MALLFDDETRRRLIAEHKANPVAGPVKILEESYSSEEACEHALFLKRIADLMDRYAA